MVVGGRADPVSAHQPHALFSSVLLSLCISISLSFAMAEEQGGEKCSVFYRLWKRCPRDGQMPPGNVHYAKGASGRRYRNRPLFLEIG